MIKFEEKIVRKSVRKSVQKSVRKSVRKSVQNFQNENKQSFAILICRGLNTSCSKMTLTTILNHGQFFGGANISQHRMLKDILGNQKNLILDPESWGKGGREPKVWILPFI